MDINAFSDTENTQWMEPVEFHETIVPFAIDKEEAAKEAKQYIDSIDKLSLQRDSSCLNTETSKTRVALKGTEWKSWRTYLVTNKEVFDTELYVIGMALNIILRDRRPSRGSTS